MAKLSKRLENAYRNYSMKYKTVQDSMRRRGMEMFDRKLTKKEYIANRQALQAEGVNININQTLVSQQQYSYDRETARRFKDTAEKLGLEWKGKKIRELRYGDIDVKEINDMLKDMNPEWNGYERARYISHNIFGSK